MIFSETTFESMLDLLTLLSPIQDLIAIAESDESNAAGMFHSFSTFHAELRCSDSPWSVQALDILERRRPALCHPVLILNCCHNPFDQGRSLEGLVDSINSEIEQALEMLVHDTAVRNIIFGQLLQFRARTGLFECRSIWMVAHNKIVDALTWQKSSSCATELSSIAIRVLEIPLRAHQLNESGRRMISSTTN